MLRARLDVNGKSLGVITMTQVADLGIGDLRRYKFHVHVTLNDGPFKAVSGTLTHHRDDGALTLLRRTLQEAGF